VRAAAGLVIDGRQEVGPVPARTEERAAKVAEMLNRQSPKPAGTRLDRGGNRQGLGAGSRAVMQGRSTGRQHGLTARSAGLFALDLG
jgi:hypothetical protein